MVEWVNILIVSCCLFYAIIITITTIAALVQRIPEITK